VIHTSLIQAIAPPHLTPLLDGSLQPALKTRPSKGGGHILICAFTNKAFGGIFTESEAQALVIWAKRRTQPVSPLEFGNAAAQIVKGVVL
jgi:hypothetical protein